eukprot:6349889-Prymnesium_polylepis.1
MSDAADTIKYAPPRAPEPGPSVRSLRTPDSAPDRGQSGHERTLPSAVRSRRAADISTAGGA